MAKLILILFAVIAVGAILVSVMMSITHFYCHKLHSQLLNIRLDRLPNMICTWREEHQKSLDQTLKRRRWRPRRPAKVQPVCQSWKQVRKERKLIRKNPMMPKWVQKCEINKAPKEYLQQFIASSLRKSAPYFPSKAASACRNESSKAYVAKQSRLIEQTSEANYRKTSKKSIPADIW